MPYKLQFFAEPDGGGGDGGDGGTDQNQNNQGQAQTIDYDKIQSMIETATSKKENAILKSYFQQQGMTEDEAKQAMETYKANKQSQQPDVAAIQTQLQQAQQLAAKAEIERLATVEAIGLGIDVKTLPYVLKMADLSQVNGQDGKVNQENLKAALNKVLEDVPALKPSNQQNGGFQIGGSGGSNNNQATDDALKAAFGL